MVQSSTRSWACSDGSGGARHLDDRPRHPRMVGVQHAAAGTAREAVRRRGEARGRHRKRPAGDLGRWRPTCRSGFNDHVARELAFRQGLSSSRGQRSGETHIPCNSGGARRFAGITRIYSPAGWRSRSGKPNGSFAGATSRVTAHSMNPATPTCCSRSPMSKPRAGTPLSRVEHRTPGPNDAATRGNARPYRDVRRDAHWPRALAGFVDCRGHRVGRASASAGAACRRSWVALSPHTSTSSSSRTAGDKARVLLRPLIRLFAQALGAGRCRFARRRSEAHHGRSRSGR